tara:strand:+ start:234 stop:851 length:618 start_codon:yes stop_codon:yes gene_type:complete
MIDINRLMETDASSLGQRILRVANEVCELKELEKKDPDFEWRKRFYKEEQLRQLIHVADLGDANLRVVDAGFMAVAKLFFRVTCMKIEFRVKRRLWLLWHGRLPYLFSERHYCDESRPWWHICCNGDGGGWRTTVCDWLEYRWRHLEDVLYADHGLSFRNTNELKTIAKRFNRWGYWFGGYKFTWVHLTSDTVEETPLDREWDTR